MAWTYASLAVIISGIMDARVDKSALMLTRIAPARGWLRLNLGELWKYRDLLGFLAWRDVSVRYKQTLVGAAWAIIQPVLMVTVFSLVFGHGLGIQTGELPYPIFAFAGLLPWQLFAAGMRNSSESLIGNANLLTKVYFPRLTIPMASVLPPLVDFAIAFVLLILLMVYYGLAPTWNLFWLPALLVFALGTSLGVGLWLSALNVQYRDFRYIVPFLIQAWMFLSPVIYPPSILKSETWRFVYFLNPMAGVIDGFRWALLGTQTNPWPLVKISIPMAGIVLLSGLIYFRRMEKTFADVV